LLFRSPSGIDSNTLLTYTWQAVATSTWYFLYVDDSTGNRIRQWYSADEVGCASGAGNCSVTPAIEVKGAGQWWIQTWNSVAAGPWSTAMAFTVSGDIPQAATPFSPSGTSNYPMPTYTWEAVAGSSWYYLWVDDSTGNRIKQWYTAAEVHCDSGASCWITPTTEVRGASQWQVQTYNIYGSGLWSAAQDFAIDGAIPVVATSLSPTGSIGDATPTYTWDAVPGSTWYYLWVNDARGSVIKQWYLASDLGCADGASATCSVTPTEPIQGSGQWQVQTYNVYGSGLWSDPAHFDLDAD